MANGWRLLVVPLVLLTLAVVVELHVQHGEFKTTPLGITCLWYHIKANDSTELSVGLACWCRTEVEDRQNYGCEYVTDEKYCDKDSDEFFKKIADKLKVNDNPCEAESITTEDCPDAILKRKQYNPPERTCMGDEKTEL